MQKKTTVKNKSIKKVIIYSAVVALLLLASLLFRFFTVLRNSKFDGENRFTIAITDTSEKTYIYSLEPSHKTLSRLTLEGKEVSYNPGRTVGIPIDGFFKLKNNENIDSSDYKGIFLSLFFHGEQVKSDITFIDLVRTYLYIQSLKPQDVLSDTITLPTSESDIDTAAMKLFTDQLMVKERVTIQIVNGTNREGLGKRLERLIKNSGGNVISITNTDKTEKKSKILYFGKQTYTVRKTAEMLKYPILPMKNREIADIKIVIGEDGLREEIF